MPFTSDDAKLGAGAIGAVMLLWRLFFRGKKDIREDKADARDEKSSEKIYGGYKTLLDRLESKVDDQDRFNHALGERLNIETDRRRDCERRNHELELRIEHLEAAVRRLGGVV